MDIILRQTRWIPETTDTIARVEFSIVTPQQTWLVYIAGAGLQAQPGLEAGVALAVLPAMRLGCDLRVEGRLSETFLYGVREYIRIFVEAFPEFKAIAVKSSGTYSAACCAAVKRCGSFFSGGVDSFFTLMKGRDEITDIMYIHGFDVRLDDVPRRQAVDEMCQAVAAQLGVNFIAIESNMGKMLQHFGSWPLHAHGLALLAVSRALAGYLQEVRIPGSFTIDGQKPWGSWLKTDPLFSDERLTVVHDACQAGRIDKVKRLATEPLALRYLRVCWERVDGMYNCCRCEKCLRTMTTLHILGALENAEAFSLPLEPEQVAAVCLPRPGIRVFPRENLQLLRESGLSFPALERALIKQIKRPIRLSVWRLKWRKRWLRWQRKLGLLDKE